jgi:hypothetical protein
MEEAPANGKESSYSAHGNGIEEKRNYTPVASSDCTVV